ncbi:MAG TPA: isochorismatase family protein [Arthrobacter sp.]
MSTPRRAPILIDVQQQYFNGPLQIQYPPHDESMAMIVRALDAAAAAGIPIAAVQHSAGEGAPVFEPGTPEFELHPEIERRRTDTWKGVIKQYGSVYADTDLAGWLRQHDFDTLVGYMTNNCILASAVKRSSSASLPKFSQMPPGLSTLRTTQGSPTQKRCTPPCSRC